MIGDVRSYQNSIQPSAYQQALGYLHQFTNLEHQHSDQYQIEALDPTRLARFLVLLGVAYDQVPAIHIAGTKGKGSVAAMCAFCLRAAGLRVGLYTSPHLIDFRERIRILTPEDANGRIPQPAFVACVDQVKTAVAQVPHITWFELITAIALLHFTQQDVDVMVIEAGLGGRVDATNIITPLVSVITSLSLDHTALLGETLAQIAQEKGGIIKPTVPVVMAPPPDEALSPLLALAQAQQSPVIQIGRQWQYQPGPQAGSPSVTITHSPDPDFIPVPTTFHLSLAGAHQRENAVVALAALHQLRSRFPGITAVTAAQGLAQTQWPGRLQQLYQAADTPTILVDCAHNVDSAMKLGQALQDYAHERLWLILGITADKDVAGIMTHLLPLAHTTIITRADHPRAATVPTLRRIATQLGYDAVLDAPTAADALIQAWRLAQAADLICVTGSIFVVGDLLNEWKRLESLLQGKSGAAAEQR